MRNLLVCTACVILGACSTTPVYKPVVSPAPLPPARTYDKDTDLAEAMRQAIRRHFVPPAGNFSPATEVTIDLVVFSDGAVVDVQISKSSGNEQLDHAVLLAARRAQPLPVLKEVPKEPGKESAVSPGSQKYRLVLRPFAAAVK